MAFIDLDIDTTYNTSKDDLINNFFVPLLDNSKKYDRGVGYFSSSWINEALEGMLNFANNGGKARWIASPILSKEDWEALQLGDQAKSDEILRKSINNVMEQLFTKCKKDSCIALAWMIADGIIDFKLAKPINKLNNEFHAKIGIFTDNEGNSISFDGSYNDSAYGLENYESIKVFKSWDGTADYVAQEIEQFNRIWNNQDPNIAVFDIPSASKDDIVKIVRNEPRPYKEPESSKSYFVFDIPRITPPIPEIPKNIKLRDYQNEAISNWFANNCKGIFEMATGTGKTYTALSCAVKLFEQQGRLPVIVLCPYIHLAKQWQEEAEKFGFRPIVVAESKIKWLENAHKTIRDFSQNRLDQCMIITTNTSFQKGELRDLFEQYALYNQALIIADEMHHCGSKEMLKILPPQIPFRLGLSATPSREYDEFGTTSLYDYFGKIVYTFDLKMAIEQGFLTPYYYHPEPVYLTEEEFDEYIDLTNKLTKLHPKEDEPISEAALRIAIKRTRVQNNSISKLFWLQNNIIESNEIHHTIFYTGDKIFSQVLSLLGVEKHLIVHQFTYKENMAERSRLLEAFERGDLQALVAMKCLDEGVDVPPTETAYFLASSSISREFVQRRGRILRNWPGKDNANVIDLISIPPERFIRSGKSSEDYRVVRSAIKREYLRVKEFSQLAINKYTSLENFVEIADRFDLLSI
jgi:superfamily II DNA or RNA helicase